MSQNYPAQSIVCQNKETMSRHLKQNMAFITKFILTVHFIQQIGTQKAIFAILGIRMPMATETMNIQPTGINQKETLIDINSIKLFFMRRLA